MKMLANLAIRAEFLKSLQLAISLVVSSRSREIDTAIFVNEFIPSALAVVIIEIVGITFLCPYVTYVIFDFIGEVILINT
jgi:hypothetical protein